ncbi:hypothetical protein McanMca71_005969 [Microsporum canis]|uniref:Zn(2)-C6 fungal-type domain-containing protein n=1 Tax=Arthroderma otae (strain ATCC MYA-4605 / CBS 113480) TaxID=554155 RepID=C5FG95_ARTOC|nr:uncharacterized protein MCYG_02599 [Microsporum canis CBS 113480]EEQ29780.1 predicted protein [Microsporum canis CBS 113480]
MAELMDVRDILERHLPIHHAVSKGTQRILVACQTCRYRKSKCDSGDPCLMCSHLKVPCIRAPSSAQATPTRDALPQIVRQEVRDENPAQVGLRIDKTWDGSPVCNEDSGNTPEPMRKGGTKCVLANAENQNTNTLNWPSIDEWMSETRTVPFEGDLVEALLALPSRELDDDNQLQIILPTTPESTTNMGHSCLPDTVFHEAWAILHHSTLEQADQFPLLLQAIALVKWPPPMNNERNKLAKELMAHLVIGPEDFNTRLVETFRNIQALVVALISYTTEDIMPESAHWAAQGTDIVISAMRRMGMFAGRWVPVDIIPEHRWICEEEIKRMAYAALRLDVYFSIIINRPPSLRFQELHLALPVTKTLWKASKVEDRYHIQWFEPAGRDRCIFQSAVQDFFQTRGGLVNTNRMQPFEEPDSHLALCAIQVELWSATQAVRGDRDCSTRFMTSTQQSGNLGFQSSHLLYCQAYLEDAYKRGQICFVECPETQHFWLALNLTLYHLTLLNIHADISLLEHQNCGDARQEAETQRILRAWVDSMDGRKAVYHAVQLQQKYECKTCAAWPEYYNYWNPLRPTALLYSCIILCAYNAECAVSVMENSSAVELSVEEDISAGPIHDWIQKGGCASIRGAVLGRSAISQLVSWARERLAPFNTASRRFERFLYRVGDYC